MSFADPLWSPPMTASPASAVHMTVTARKLFDSDFYLARVQPAFSAPSTLNR